LQENRNAPEKLDPFQYSLETRPIQPQVIRKTAHGFPFPNTGSPPDWRARRDRRDSPGIRLQGVAGVHHPPPQRRFGRSELVPAWETGDFAVRAPETGTYGLYVTGGQGGQAWYAVRIGNPWHAIPFTFESGAP